MTRAALLLSAIALFSPSALAVPPQNLESAFRTTGSAVTAAFEPQRAVLQTSSAVVLDGRTQVSYGTVISTDGYVLTKASEIQSAEDLIVLIDTKRYEDVAVLVVNGEWDVALLKVNAKELVPVDLAASSAVPQGTWVVANGATSRRARRALGGVVSANHREIPAEGGVALGVVLKQQQSANPDAEAEDGEAGEAPDAAPDETPEDLPEGEPGPALPPAAVDGEPSDEMPEPQPLEIESVNDKSGAAEAGLQAGDLILSVDGTAVTAIEDIAELLKDRRSGSIVKVRFVRDGGEMEVDVRLSARSELFDDQMSRNDQMSGLFSKRRSGFPRILQHDILGARSVVGGPLLDLDGRCIGMNIARANRCESYAIPVEDLKELIARLMSAVPPPSIP